MSFVGNKSRYEGISIPKTTLTPLHDFAHEMMITHLLKPFEKMEEFFYFHHEEDVSNHPVYQVFHSIFADPDYLQKAAVNQLTQQLYESCLTPKIQGGELIFAYLEGLVFMGETVSGVALVKIQSKEQFLKAERSAEAFTLNVLEGIPTGKLETAALVLNIDEAEGYRVYCIDTVSKKDELSFWRDDFMKLRPIEDNYFNTRHYIGLAAEFVTQKAPFKFGLDRTDQIDLLNRSSLYFKENEQFELDDFSGNLFPEPEQAEAFKEFRDEYAKAYAIPLEDSFDISKQAVKRENKVFKSVIKLDKNFHIYVHGRRDLIERGFDEDKGKNFYKVFYEEEN